MAQHMGVLEALKYVGTGLSLVAFAIAAILLAYRARLTHRTEIIKSAPEKDRLRAIATTAEFFRVDVSNLTRAQQHDIVLAQIQARARRELLWAGTFLAAAVLLAAVATAALWASRPAASTAGAGRLAPPFEPGQAPLDAARGPGTPTEGLDTLRSVDSGDKFQQLITAAAAWNLEHNSPNCEAARKALEAIREGSPDGILAAKSRRSEIENAVKDLIAADRILYGPQHGLTSTNRNEVPIFVTGANGAVAMELAARLQIEHFYIVSEHENATLVINIKLEGPTLEGGTQVPGSGVSVNKYGANLNVGASWVCGGNFPLPPIFKGTSGETGDRDQAVPDALNKFIQAFKVRTGS